MSRPHLSPIPLLLVLTACSTVSGRYALQTRDGEPLPIGWSNNRELTAVHLQLDDDGTCGLTNSVRTEGGAVAIEEDWENCTWTADGTTIRVTLSDQNGASTTTITGSVVVGRLNLTAPEGAALVYVRQ